MVFSSPLFLFGFLPIALLMYFLSPMRLKNLTLLSLSLFFYAWGEVFYLGVMVVSILSNYIFGLLIFNSQKKPHSKKSPQLYLMAGIGVNGVLFGYNHWKLGVGY